MNPGVPAMTAGRTSVIVVAADSGVGLVDCIGDVLASTADVEVLVSDNASSDGSIAALEARYGSDPRLKILRNHSNLGFGPGANRAAAVALGDAFFLLNPDCRIAPHVITHLRDLATSVPTLGILGPRIVDASGKVETATRRHDPTFKRAIATLTGRDAAGQGISMPPRKPEQASEEPVDAVSGAAMWLPRHAYEMLHGFDETYFLHCEDLDLCRRARDNGLAVIYVDAVEVVHAKGGSSRHRPVFVAWHKHRGMWRWFRQHDPAARNPFIASLVAVGLCAHFIATLPLRWFSGMKARQQKAAV